MGVIRDVIRDPVNRNMTALCAASRQSGGNSRITVPSTASGVGLESTIPADPAGSGSGS